jgi:hypothetical protein
MGRTKNDSNFAGVAHSTNGSHHNGYNYHWWWWTLFLILFVCSLSFIPDSVDTTHNDAARQATTTTETDVLRSIESQSPEQKHQRHFVSTRATATMISKE